MKIAIDCFYDSLSKANEAVCGDRVIHSYDEHGFLCVLADGLGSGVKANILATMTATILHRLLRANIPLKEAICTLSATLPQCKVRSIAYSTFSLVQINDDGKVILVEFDNPSVNVLREQQIVHIEKQQQIYDDRIIYYSEFNVVEHDLLIMISDGALYAGKATSLNFRWQESDMLKHLINSTLLADTAQSIGKYMISSIHTLYEKQPKDDATVVICKIKKRTNSIVVVGPPKDKIIDAKIVKQLVNTDGLKIICGGTTSQIVARELNTRVIVDETYLDQGNLPPTALISGMDFVSEGILTLGRLVDLLVEASNNKSYKESMLEGKAQDGAQQLFQLLLLECTNIAFYVGQANNQAHNYLADALTVNMKNNLIHRIAGYLRNFGKLVSIHYV